VTTNKKKGKTINNSNKTCTCSKKYAKERIKVIDEYIDCNIMRKKPLTQIGLRNFMCDMRKEVGNDENITSITQYLLKKGVPRITYYKWRNIFDFVKETHDVVMTIIADRNQQKVAGDFRYINIVQPMYDPYVFKEGAKFWSNLKKEERKNQFGDQVVLIKEIADTGKVPDKK